MGNEQSGFKDGKGRALGSARSTASAGSQQAGRGVDVGGRLGGATSKAGGSSAARAAALARADAGKARNKHKRGNKFRGKAGLQTAKERVENSAAEARRREEGENAKRRREVTASEGGGVLGKASSSAGSAGLPLPTSTVSSASTQRGWSLLGNVSRHRIPFLTFLRFFSSVLLCFVLLSSLLFVDARREAALRAAESRNTNKNFEARIAKKREEKRRAEAEDDERRRRAVERVGATLDAEMRAVATTAAGGVEAGAAGSFDPTRSAINSSAAARRARVAADYGRFADSNAMASRYGGGGGGGAGSSGAGPSGAGSSGMAEGSSFESVLAAFRRDCPASCADSVRDAVESALIGLAAGTSDSSMPNETLR